MLYAILGRDAPNSLNQRLAVRPAHLERLNALLAEGRLILAGPLPAIDSADPGPAGFQGSLMVVEFPSLEEATTWAVSYTHLDVYKRQSLSGSARFSATAAL